MPAKNTKERSLQGIAPCQPFSLFCWLLAFQPMPYHASGGLYNWIFLPRQLYFIQMENCYRFFLNVKGRFALPCSKEQIVPFTTQALGPTNH